MVRGDIKKQVTIVVVLAFTVNVMLILTGSIISLSIEDIRERKIQRYTKKIVSQYKDIITIQLDKDMQILDTVAALTGQTGADGINDVLSYPKGYIKGMSRQNDLLRMGTVSSGGLGYFANADRMKHYGIGIGGEEFVRRMLNGGWMASDIEEDRLSAKSVIFCGVSITHDGNVIDAVAATRTTDNLSEVISRGTSDGVAFIYIVDQSGDLIPHSDHAVIQKEIDNIFDEGDATEEAKASIPADIKNDGDSFAIFRYQGRGC